ncbi:MAG: M24 family metallopeptidase [Candidatus Hodarchaeota archaeon]
MQQVFPSINQHNAVRRMGIEAQDQGGYGKYVIHGIGHGLGFESHEMPSLAKDREMVLQKGIVITIEPAVYLPGEFGIRIEDDVLVTDGGKEVITTLGNELVQI